MTEAEAKEWVALATGIAEQEMREARDISIGFRELKEDAISLSGERGDLSIDTVLTLMHMAYRHGWQDNVVFTED